MRKSMLKYTIFSFVLLICFTAMPSVSTATASKDYFITINGDRLDSDARPVNRNGSIFVPMRAIFEALNAKVSYSAKEQKVTGIRGNTTLELWINRNEASLNGKPYAISQAPFILNNRVYVPVRVISEALNAHVKWNKDELTVQIESSLLTHRESLPIINDRDQFVTLEHNGNMKLKWSYQDESPYQMFNGFVAGEDRFIFKGFNKAYVMNKNGELLEKWEFPVKDGSMIKAYVFSNSNTAKVVSSNPSNTWENIPLLRHEFEYSLDSSNIINIAVVEAPAVIDSSGNLIILTTEGLTAYAPDGKKLWSHLNWKFEDQIISALQYADRMTIDALGRIYIFYWDRTVIVNKDGKLLTSIEDNYFGLYPLNNGQLLSQSGVYELSDDGQLKSLFNGAFAARNHYATTELSVTSYGDHEEDVLWTFQLPSYEINKGQRIFESTLTEDIYGNTYFSAQNGTVYGLNRDGELIFKLIIDHRIISSSQIIPLSEHELIIVNDNAIFFFTL